MADAHRPCCLADTLAHGAPSGRNQPHPFLPELGNAVCCSCVWSVQLTREALRLNTENVPLAKALTIMQSIGPLVNGFTQRFQAATAAGDGFGVGCTSGRERICAFCVKPASDPMLECHGSRDGTACRLAFHPECHERCMELERERKGLPASYQLPPRRLICCANWGERKERDDVKGKDLFTQPRKSIRTRCAKRGAIDAETLQAKRPKLAAAKPQQAPPAAVPAADAPAVAATDMAWSCPECSEENDEASLFCEACEACNATVLPRWTDAPASSHAAAAPSAVGGADAMVVVPATIVAGASMADPPAAAPPPAPTAPPAAASPTAFASPRQRITRLPINELQNELRAQSLSVLGEPEEMRRRLVAHYEASSEEGQPSSSSGGGGGGVGGAMATTPISVDRATRLCRITTTAACSYTKLTAGLAAKAAGNGGNAASPAGVGGAASGAASSAATPTPALKDEEEEEEEEEEVAPPPAPKAPRRRKAAATEAAAEDPVVGGVDWSTTAIDPDYKGDVVRQLGEGGQCVVLAGQIARRAVKGRFADVFAFGVGGDVAALVRRAVAIKTPKRDRDLGDAASDDAAANAEMALAAGKRIRDNGKLAWEARILRKLRGHANVVEIIGFDARPEAYAQLYLPILVGLSKLLANRHQMEAKWGARLVRACVAAAVRAVAHMHRHGVSHRDLKVDNILLDVSKVSRATKGRRLLTGAPQPEHVKFCDFGYSLMSPEMDGEEPSLPGTPPYTAPEVLMARRRRSHRRDSLTAAGHSAGGATTSSVGASSSAIGDAAATSNVPSFTISGVGLYGAGCDVTFRGGGDSSMGFGGGGSGGGGSGGSPAAAAAESLDWKAADLFSLSMLLWALMHKNCHPHFPAIEVSSFRKSQQENMIEKAVSKGARPKLEGERGAEKVDEDLRRLWAALCHDDDDEDTPSILARGWHADPTKRPTAQAMRDTVQQLLNSHA